MNQQQWIPLERSTATNVRHIATISAVMHLVVVVVFTLIGVLVGQLFVGLAIGVAAGAFLVRSIRRGAEQKVLDSLGGEPASETEHARLFNVVDGLCVVGGDQRPVLRVVDAGFPIALIAAMPGSAGTIVVSSGFVSLMGRIETESVVAHLMARLRSGDIALTTYLMSLSQLLSRIGLGSLARYIVAKTTDERSVLVADIASCQATRYPPGLISALEIVVDHSQETLHRLGARPLWFATPDGSRNDTTREAGLSSLGFERPSLDERIALLKEI